MFNHKGRENAVGAREIEAFLQLNGFNGNSAGGLVSDLRNDGYPICSAASHGYYWGVGYEDFQETIDDLEARAKALNQTVKALKKMQKSKYGK